MTVTNLLTVSVLLNMQKIQVRATMPRGRGDGGAGAAAGSLDDDTEVEAEAEADVECHIWFSGRRSRPVIQNISCRIHV